MNMSAVSSTQYSLSKSRVSSERFFFFSITMLISAAVFYGFGSEYVQFRAEYFPFPSLLVYIHAALFFAWMLLLLIQTSLVSAGRIAWHRRLGIAGVFLLCSMPIIGALTLTAAVAHNRLPPGFEPLAFYYDALTSLIVFAVLAYFALRYRNAPQTHKRLILLATVVIGEAGVFRWPVRWIHEVSHGIAMVTYFFLLLIVLYDISSRRRIHPATLWGGLFVIFYEETQNFIGHSNIWHSVASGVLHAWPK
jgi:FtsH-binding integral membrane protein